MSATTTPAANAPTPSGVPRPPDRAPSSLRKKLVFALVPLVAMLLIGEAVCRLYMARRPPYAHMAYRLTDPAYAGKPWFSEDFLLETGKLKDWYTPEGTRLILPFDLSTRYMVVKDGIRRTTGLSAPAGAPPVRVFVFGGSTTFCAEVPDELTWPSQLQRLLAADPRTRRVEVVNFGTVSVNSKQEVERLEREVAKGNVPAVALFYDGVNDIIQGVYNNNPDGMIYESEKNYNRTLVRRLERVSKLVYVVRGIGRKYVAATVSPHLSDPARLEEAARRSAEGYAANLRRAKKVCDGHGVRFAAMLQPNVFTIARPLTPHEQAAVDRSQAGMGMAFRAANPRLQELVPILRADGVQITDLSRIFDENTKPMFFDFCHVQDDGNALIAAAVHRELVRLLGEWGMLDAGGP